MQWNVAGLRESLVEAPFGNWLFVKCQGLVLGHGGIPWHWKGVSLSTQVPLVLEASCPLLPLKSMEVGGAFCTSPGERECGAGRWVSG